MNQKRQKYTKEFKEQAAKLVIEQGYTHSGAGKSLGVSVKNIGRWVDEQQRGTGRLGQKSDSIHSENSELEKLRKENKRLSKRKRRLIRYHYCVRLWVLAAADIISIFMVNAVSRQT